MVRLLILAFLMIAALHAAPTAAWKVSLETLASDHKTNEKIRKLDKPPGESAFFQPGDELWDVAGILRDGSLLAYGYLENSYEEEEKPRGAWKGEWAVWNARSGMLVARGTHADLLKAQLAWNFEQTPNFTAAESKAQPNVIRCRLDWMRPGATNAFQSISMICQNGELTKTSVGDISLEANPSLGYIDQRISLRIAASWSQAKDHERWEATTALDLEDGKRTFLAKHGSGETGWELYLTCQEERRDGTPAAGVRLLETKSGGVQQWPGGFAAVPGVFRIPLEGQRSIVWYPTGEFHGMSLPIPLQKGSLEVPESLRNWIDGPLVDVAKLLREESIEVDSPGFFAGFQPLAGQLVVAGNDQVQAAVAKLTREMAPGKDIPLFVESNAASGNNGIVVRNGEKAAISKLKGEEAETIFEMEATRGVGSITVRLYMKLVTNGKDRGELLTATDVTPGQWQKIMEAKSGEETEVLIRAGNSHP